MFFYSKNLYRGRTAPTHNLCSLNKMSSVLLPERFSSHLAPSAPAYSGLLQNYSTPSLLRFRALLRFTRMNYCTLGVGCQCFLKKICIPHSTYNILPQDAFAPESPQWMLNSHTLVKHRRLSRPALGHCMCFVGLKSTFNFILLVLQ